MIRKSVVRQVAGAILAVALVAPAAAQDRFEKRPQLSITGEAEVSVEPDLAELRAGVTTEGRTAREASDANRKAMVAVVAAVRTLDIADRDVATSRFVISPVYDNTRPQRDRITGFRASNSITVKIRKLDQTGDAVDRLVTAGANTIGGISFIVSNPSKWLDDARAQAMADARRKGEIYAKAAGVTLGRAFTIQEQSANAPPRPMMMELRQAAAPAEPTPVAPGEQTLRVSVSVTFDLDR